MFTDAANNSQGIRPLENPRRWKTNRRADRDSGSSGDPHSTSAARMDPPSAAQMDPPSAIHMPLARRESCWS